MTNPAGPSRWLARVGLLLGAAALMLVLAEGATSLVLGRPLLRAPAPGAVRVVSREAAPVTDTERRHITAKDAGPYAVHRDPLVGYVLRGEAHLDIAGGAVTTDVLGLRARPGPPHDGTPLRVAVLGDSVAFGYGLDDHQALAAQLEELLAPLRPDDGRPVECRTVAIPGWNCRNAVSFLLDTWSELKPDIVLYVPIGNDLLDTDGVLENGMRRRASDPTNADPWLLVAGTPSFELARQFIRHDPEAIRALSETGGPIALLSDLSAESTRRLDENAGLLAMLSGYLSRQGSRLMLLAFDDSTYFWHLRTRLVRSGVADPVLAIFRGDADGLMLPDDPHPNADAIHVMAIWTAAELLARGWIPSRPDRSLPSPGETWESRRAPGRSDEEYAQLSAETRARALLALRPTIDFTTGEGVAQVYGNLNDDGSAGMRLLVALAAAGPLIEVELAPVAERPDLYPLTVEVKVDGVAVGSLEVPATGSARRRFTLPARRAPDAPLELRLAPRRWVTVQIGDRSQLVSFRPVRLAVMR